MGPCHTLFWMSLSTISLSASLKFKFLSFQGDDSQCVSRLIRGARIADFILSANQIFRLPTILKNVRGGGIVFVEKRRRIFTEAVQLQKKTSVDEILANFGDCNVCTIGDLILEELAKTNPDATSKIHANLQMLSSWLLAFQRFLVRFASCLEELDLHLI